MASTGFRGTPKKSNTAELEGDELRVESEVLEVRPSRSRPQQGLVKLRTTTLNQNGEAVQIMVANLLVPRRPAATGSARS